MSSLSLSRLTGVTLLLLLLPSSLVTSHDCPGFYPDPQACDQFYQCDSHNSYLFHCPDGTLFDVNLGFCNHQYLVKCPSPTQPPTRPTTSEPRPSPATLAPVVTDSAAALTMTDTDLTTETPASSSDSLITDNDNIFLDLSKPSTTVSPTVSTAGEITSTSSPEVVTELNLPSDSAPVTRPEAATSTPAPAPSEPEFMVSVSSLYPCSQPGYYSEETSCSQFYVCKEVAPGLLSADRIFSCPDRYLFDPGTRLCQREEKVSCDAEETPDLFYSGFNLFVVKLTEEDLDSFFSQDLRLAREKNANRYNLPLLSHYQQPHQPLQWFYPGLAWLSQ